MGGSEEGDGSMPDLSGDRSLRDRDYNPEKRRGDTTKAQGDDEEAKRSDADEEMTISHK